MYFPFLELHGWGKRFAARPQTIYSEIPKEALIQSVRADGRGLIQSFPNFTYDTGSTTDMAQRSSFTVRSRNCLTSSAVTPPYTAGKAK